MNKYIKYINGEILINSGGVMVSIEDISMNMLMDKWSTRELMRKMGQEQCNYCAAPVNCVHRVVSKRLLKKRSA